MQVKHILSHEIIARIRNGNAIVTDGEGNERGLDGSLSDGDRLIIRSIKKNA
jgi:hypothetical protein